MTCMPPTFKTFVWRVTIQEILDATYHTKTSGQISQIFLNNLEAMVWTREITLGILQYDLCLRYYTVIPTIVDTPTVGL